MNDRLRDAYYQYASEQVRAGIIDHSLDVAILEGKTVEEHIVEVLRAAGRLPEGWERDVKHVDMRNDSSRLLQGIGQIVAGKSRFAHLTPAREAAVERSIYTGVVKRAGYDGVVLVGLAS